MKATKEQIESAFLGLIVGDALGVPVEFEPRAALEANPVKDMTGNGTYDMPPGTWSDDSSLMLCLAESLLQGFDTQNMGDLFVKWYKEGYWTPYGEMFDVGTTTSRALDKIAAGIPADEAAENSQSANGNGSLMRILPLAFTLDGLSEQEKFDRVRKASAVTHKHIRSVIACYIYIKFVEALLSENALFKAYRKMQIEVNTFLKTQKLDRDEIAQYHRILKKDIFDVEEYEIESEGYVVYTIEAALWCLLNSNSYHETVLKAVNLGLDTDTTAAVVGGLAGLYYGLDEIPKPWLKQIPRLNDIKILINRFTEKYT